MAKLDVSNVFVSHIQYSSHPLTHCFIHSTTTKTILQEGRPEQRNASDAAALAAKVAKKAEMKQTTLILSRGKNENNLELHGTAKTACNL